MGKDNDMSKDIGEGEDGDLLSFDFDEDFLGEEEKAPGEDVPPQKSEARGDLFESAAWEVVSQFPSAREKDTAILEKVQEPGRDEPHPSTDLIEEIDLDEELEGLIFKEEERAPGEDVPPQKSEARGDLFESAAWEVVSQFPSDQEEKASEETTPVKEIEAAVREEALPISEENLEALLGKVVSDVLEKVARELIAQVAEKMIREEIDVLKRTILAED